DNGSSRVRPPHHVTALAGLAAALGADRIVTGDESDLVAARAAAAGADAVVIIAGYTAEQEGEFIPGDITLGQENSAAPDLSDLPETARESRKRRNFSIGGDRIDLGLPADQRALIDAAAVTGKPVIVVIVAGSAVLVETWHDKADAILQTFYSGMEGGTALARLLLGDTSPSGRLPFTVARDAGDYPPFDRDAVAVTYDYWHGYARLVRDGKPARYAFGHGLSYSCFTTRALTARRRGDAIELTVAVANTGTCAADHVVLLWAEPPGSIDPCWPRRLAAFTRISLAAGETRIAALRVPLASLRWRDPATHAWQLEPGQWRFVIAESAEAPAMQTAILAL
ncbi:MAG: glycoside hydrolase family 3 C-terminal domain-containing protein, partial [Sandarakinorhabdus sp.]|nr:glycoside hydrolase family 3 C-terminal domain-containing protein [Sandarakinorhabdus sp.]